MTDTFVLTLKSNSILVPFFITGSLHSKKPSILQNPSVASLKTVHDMAPEPDRNDEQQPSVDRKRKDGVWLKPSNDFFSTSGQAEATIEGAKGHAEPKGDYNPDERKITVEVRSFQENERFTEKELTEAADLQEVIDACHIEIEEEQNTKSVKEWLKDPGLYKVLSTMN